MRSLYKTFSRVTTQLRRKDAPTHNVDTVCVEEDCNRVNLYINIHSFLMYTVVKIISTPQTFRQLFTYSCLKHRDLLFMIFTLQNSVTALWLKQWLQFALSHIQNRKTFQLCDMCAVLGWGLQQHYGATSVFSSDTLPHYPILLTHNNNT